MAGFTPAPNTREVDHDFCRRARRIGRCWRYIAYNCHRHGGPIGAVGAKFELGWDVSRAKGLLRSVTCPSCGLDQAAARRALGPMRALWSGWTCRTAAPAWISGASRSPKLPAAWSGPCTAGFATALSALATRNSDAPVLVVRRQR